MKTSGKFLAVVLFAFTIIFIAGCGKSEEHKMDESAGTVNQIDSTIIHDHSVDVASLDANKDGNVYQCPMDWNVISDSSGSCPVCKMDLEQYSAAEAQKNLEENEPRGH